MKAKSLVLAIAAAGCVAALPAYAHPMLHFRSGHQLRHVDEGRAPVADAPAAMTPAAAPELDPAIVTGALTLLAGGLALIRARRRKDG